MELFDLRGTLNDGWPSKSLSVVAVVEPTWHDNSNEESDQAPKADGESEYGERRQLSVTDAIDWAHAFGFPVTLFLYDDDGPGDHSV